MSEQVLLGRYRVLSVLGKGGMGIVYRCHDTVADTLVAVKGLIPGQAKPEDLAEIKENFQLVAALRHPSIAGLRNIEQDADGTYYLVMDYIDGHDLTGYIHNHTPSLESLFIILDNVASALDYAHENGIIHRDIKPDNIKIDTQNTIKVLDFGIATAVSSSRASDAGGTPEYMAPEQWYGEAQTGATDQYALAALAYRCLYGKVPHGDMFRQETDMTKMAHAVSQNPVTFPTGTPAAVQEVFRRALANAPADRYPSCTDFVNALAYATGHRRPPRKSRLGWIIAAVVVLVAAGVTGCLVLQNRQAKASHQAEQDALVQFYQQKIEEMQKRQRESTARTEAERQQDQRDLEEMQQRLREVENRKKTDPDQEKKDLAAELKKAQDLEAERERKAQAERDRIAREEQERQARERKEQAERERKAREERERKEREEAEAKKAAAATGGISPELAAKLLARGAGFFTAEYGCDTRRDLSRAFRVWSDPDRKAVLVADGLARRDLREKRMIVYATFMRMRAGVVYTFRAYYDDRAFVMVDNRLVVRELSGIHDVSGTISFPKDGWHLLTIVVANGYRSSGPRMPVSGVRYREGEGDWKNFAITSENHDFMTRREGLDPEKLAEKAERYFLAHADESDSTPLAPPDDEPPALTHRWSFKSGSLVDEVSKAKAKKYGIVSLVGNCAKLKGGVHKGGIDLGADLLPTDGSPITIELWASVEDHALSNRIFEYSGVSGFAWCWNYFGQTNYSMGQAGPYTTKLPGGFRPRQAYHLAAVCQGNGNGRYKTTFFHEPVGTRTAPLTIGTFSFGPHCRSEAHLRLGGSESTSVPDASCRFDEVRIWRGAFTEEDFERSQQAGPDRLPKLEER